MKNKWLFYSMIFIIILALGLGFDYAMHGISTSIESIITAIAALIAASYISSATKIADPWDKAVVFRLGKFHSLKGPGLFFIIPVLDRITYWIDTRVINISVNVENNLMNDTVQVDVDAFLIWEVLDSKILIVPSSAMEMIESGSMAGLEALTMGIGQDKVNKSNGALKVVR